MRVPAPVMQHLLKLNEETLATKKRLDEALTLVLLMFEAPLNARIEPQPDGSGLVVIPSTSPEENECDADKKSGHSADRPPDENAAE